jgi:hypothetical protein
MVQEVFWVMVLADASPASSAAAATARATDRAEPNDMIASGWGMNGQSSCHG